MKEPLRNIFELQIKSLRGFEFQDFVTELFLLKYGESGFIPPRQVKDKGCDGIILSENRSVACHAPGNYNYRDFAAKINSDFEAYQIYWEKDYPNWMFITNQEVSPDLITKINELKKNTPLLGVKNIISIIEALDNYKRRRLGKYLRIEPDYFARDYLEEILEDLLKDTETGDENVCYSKPPYMPDKININYEKEDIEGALHEYEIVTDYFKRIEELLQGYGDNGLARIKFKIINDFNEKSGSFKEKLKKQTRQYLEKYSKEQDDDYLFYIRAILINIFEQCLIGLKTEAEKKREKNDTTSP